MIDLKNIINNYDKKEIITFVGAGGKTSLMFSIGEKLLGINKKVLITTTTKIYIPDRNKYEVYIGELDEIGSSEKIIVAGSKIIKEGKLKGYKKDDINRLFKANKYDHILVEGDGAKKKPIKAPRKHEPVVPEKTGILIGVVGLDSWGLKINAKNVFGLDEFTKITGSKEGFCIDGNDIIKLIENKDGLFKIKKERNILVINKVNENNMLKAEELKMAIESKCMDFLEKIIIVEEFK